MPKMDISNSKYIDENDFTLLINFLKSHHKIILREVEVSKIEAETAPCQVKNHFLERYNLFKGLDFFIKEKL